MNKRTKILLITAVSLISLGSLTLITASKMMEKYPEQESISNPTVEVAKHDTQPAARPISAPAIEQETSDYTRIHEIGEDFSKIYIDADVSDISLAPSDNGKSWIGFVEEKTALHSVSVRGGSLFIESDDDDDKWWNKQNMKVCVYLPKSEYDLVSIETDTGNIDLSSLKLSQAELSTDTGSISLSSVTLQNFLELDTDTGTMNLKDVNSKTIEAEGDTGKIFMTNVVTSGALILENETGDIEFENCDAARITIRSSTGDIRGSFASGKTFNVKTSTGDISVPQNSSGGPCKIRSSSGDINITIS